MMESTDSQLAVMAGAGDADAYRRLFERYQHPVYNFVYRMVDNAEDAADIVQDAFIKVYNVLARQQIQNFSAYLYRTARNLAYDEMRRRSRFAGADQEVLMPEDPNIYADPQRALLLGEQIERVRQAAGGLNENQRAALILRELEGLDYEEMSAVMDSNRNAIGALLSRARLKFREELRMAHVQTEKAPRECEAVIALLSPYIDDELSAAKRLDVEGHLQQCTFCSAALEEMREASRSFRMFIPVIPPADMAQAFSGRLDQAMQAAAGRSAGEGSQAAEPGGGEAGENAPGADAAAPARPFLSRLAASRATWILTALLAALAISVFVVAEEVGHDSGIAEFFNGDAEDEAAAPAPDFEMMPDIRPAHSRGIIVPGADSGNNGQATPADSGTLTDASGADSAGGGLIVSGNASPNPVYEYSQLLLTVTVTGSPRSVSVKVGTAMTVPLTLQSSSGGEEVWSWSGQAPGRGDYPLTALAGYDGNEVSARIGTLTVIYTLY